MVLAGASASTSPERLGPDRGPGAPSTGGMRFVKLAGVAYLTLLVVSLAITRLVTVEPTDANGQRPPSVTTAVDRLASGPLATPAVSPGSTAADTSHQHNASAATVVAPARPVGETSHPYHEQPDGEAEVGEPCGTREAPGDLTDPSCVAGWTALRVALGDIDYLDSRWVDPALLAQLARNGSSDPTADPAAGLVVLGRGSQVDQVGPGRAHILVVIERTRASGLIEHLIFDVTLTSSADGQWTVIALDPG